MCRLLRGYFFRDRVRSIKNNFRAPPGPACSDAYLVRYCHFVMALSDATRCTRDPLVSEEDVQGSNVPAVQSCRHFSLLERMTWRNVLSKARKC